MPTIFRVKDLDAMFAHSPVEPIIINDLPNRTEEDRQKFDDLTESKFSSDIVSMMPSCKCGHTTKLARLGEVCDECGTPVQQLLEPEIFPKLWFRRPGPPEAPLVERFINPIIWIMLEQRLTKSGFKVLHWLTDRNYRHAGKTPDVIYALQQMGVQRGYNFFVQNFDELVNYLLNCPEFKTGRGVTNHATVFSEMLGIENDNVDPLQELLKRCRDVIFCDHLPIINRSMVVLEVHSSAIYGEKSVIDIKDVLNTMHGIDTDFYDKSKETLENRTGRIMAMLSGYYQALFKINFDPKESIPRRHLGATRTNLSFRTVMTSHEDVEDYDVIHVPWSVSVVTLTMHLQRFLMDRKQQYGGMTHNESLNFLYSHVHQYHPMLDELFQRLIGQSKYGFLSVIQQRNPSLMQGSMQRLRWTKVKTKIDDYTTSCSDLIANSMNLDYDGDETNFQIAPDNFMHEKWYPFSPFFNLTQLDKPYEIGSAASMSDPIIASTSDWLATLD